MSIFILFPKPSGVSQTLIPTEAYIEFLPVQQNGTTSDTVANSLISEKEEQELVDLVDVQLGEEYEVVVTTYTGKLRKLQFPTREKVPLGLYSK